MKRQEQDEVERLLARHRPQPSPDLVARVMAALPERPKERAWDSLRTWWEGQRRWFVPAIAGATACLFVVTGVLAWRSRTTADRHKIVFELHSPAAKSVELVGSFTEWQKSRIRLTGPDATGHWTTTVTLSPGLYEYVFLVDGTQWVPDPGASIFRADGFGQRNAILEVGASGDSI